MQIVVLWYYIYVFLGAHPIIHFFITYVSYLLTFFLLIIIIVIISIVFNHFVFASYIVCIVMYFYLLLHCHNNISNIKIIPCNPTVKNCK